MVLTDEEILEKMVELRYKQNKVMKCMATNHDKENKIIMSELELQQRTKELDTIYKSNNYKLLLKIKSVTYILICVLLMIIIYIVIIFSKGGMMFRL